MNLSTKQRQKFQQKILSWYEQNKRDLPWRQTRDPYAILISEVMSQQTQIQRVVIKYHEWLQEFPTIRALAKAPISEVLALWSGLGYNRRALNLKRTAERIASEHNGVFPDDEASLLALPGIGEYTARAVLCFAFDHQVTVVDTNVRKVILLEILNGDKTYDTPSAIKQIADRLLPTGKAYEWNQALMDYASYVLKDKKIPIPKQSTFIGSHRYYRGQVLKALLQTKVIPLNDIGVIIKKNYQQKDAAWRDTLLQELQREGFILLKDETVLLAT